MKIANRFNASFVLSRPSLFFFPLIVADPSFFAPRRNPVTPGTVRVRGAQQIDTRFNETSYSRGKGSHPASTLHAYSQQGIQGIKRTNRRMLEPPALANLKKIEAGAKIILRKYIDTCSIRSAVRRFSTLSLLPDVPPHRIICSDWNHREGFPIRTPSPGAPECRSLGSARRLLHCAQRQLFKLRPHGKRGKHGLFKQHNKALSVLLSRSEYEVIAVKHVEITDDAWLSEVAP